IHRGMSLTNALPPGAQKLKIDVLGPEQDSQRYLEPLGDALRAHGIAISSANGRMRVQREDPFSGVRSVAFHKSELSQLADFARLRRQLQTGGLAVLSAVDTTRNNTSIVMRLRFGASRLLLVGGAELMSWEIMKKNGATFTA